MKNVTMTNCTVTTLFKKNPNDADEVLRVFPPKEGTDFTNTILSFQVTTPVNDNPEKKARLYEKCTIYTADPDKIEGTKTLLKAGLLCEIKGYEERKYSEKTKEWYNSIRVKEIVPISSNNTGDAPVDEDDMPF